MDTDWIKVVCYREPGRPHMAAPFGRTIGGVRYRCATDGHRVLIVPDDTAPLSHGAPPIEELPFVLEPAEREVRLAALREWCGAVPSPPSPMVPCADCAGLGRGQCNRCKGSGVATCNMGYEHPCNRCDETRTIECRHCMGKGEAPRTEPDDGSKKPGAIGDTVIDRVLLGEMIASAPGETVRIKTRGPREMVTIDGDGWRGFLMPCLLVTPDTFTGWVQP